MAIFLYLEAIYIFFIINYISAFCLKKKRKKKKEKGKTKFKNPPVSKTPKSSLPKTRVSAFKDCTNKRQNSAFQSPPKLSTMDTASESYQKMLHESIQRFFAEYEKGVSDFSAFSSIFFRLMQASPDPPLETVWFYSALNFHSSNFTIQDPILVYRELFQLIVTCSALCNSGLKRIALLAPVIYELYRLVSEKRGFWLNSDVEFLVEGIVSYLSICCCKNSDPEVGSVHLGPGFLDVVRVWTVGRLEGNRTFGDDLSVFFPLVSDEVCQGVGVGCGVGYLAGIVMSEAFITRLCLKFDSGASRAELEKDMRNLAVEMISGFRNCYFFGEILFSSI